MRKYILRYHKIIVIVLLSLFFIQALLTLLYKSPTYDEPAHIARGYLYLKTGHLMIVGHPPLMHILSAFPLLFLNINLPTDYRDYLIKNYHTPFAQEIFYGVNDNANIIFFVSRIPLILLGVLFGFYVYKWAKEVYGIFAGLFALLIYSFNPMILGNAGLLMTDFVVTIFGAISVYHLWRFLSKRKSVDLILTGITLGLAMVSKFTALFLIPAYVFLIIGSVYDFSWYAFFKELTNKKRLRNMLSMAYASGVIILCVWLVINSVYAFDGIFKTTEERIKSDPTAYYDKEYFMPSAVAGRVTSQPLLRNAMSAILNYVPAIVPYGYVKDFMSVVRINDPSLEGSTTSGYFMGKYFKDGLWYYYIFAFLIKTPIPVLIFLIISLLSLFYFKIELKNEIFLIIPILVFFGYFATHKSIGGLRYLLPSYPFLFVFFSRILYKWEIMPKIINKIFTRILILLIIWYIIESLLIFPNYTAYFNQFVGGADNGYKFLQGSDVDNGQDLPLLNRYVNKHGIKNLKLAYHGTADPYYYVKTNITCLACPECPKWTVANCPEDCNKKSGIIAVSVNIIQNTPQLKNRECLDWIKAYAPVEKVGYSIFVYSISQIK